jgi:hypothetical protein
VYSYVRLQARITELMAQHTAALTTLKDENTSLRSDIAATEREFTTRLADTKNEADKRVDDVQAATQQQVAALAEQLTTATTALELARTVAAASAAAAAAVGEHPCALELQLATCADSNCQVVIALQPKVRTMESTARIASRAIVVSDILLYCYTYARQRVSNYLHVLSSCILVTLPLHNLHAQYCAVLLAAIITVRMS